MSWGTTATITGSNSSNSSSSNESSSAEVATGPPLHENSLGLLGFNGVVHSLGNLDMAMGCAAHGSHGISGTPR